GGETTHWTDTVLLTRNGGGWLVGDVLFGGGWDFANKGTLLDSLAPLPRPVSPEGRFEFVRFDPAEVDAGKPPFGIVEKSFGKLIWSAPDELGDPSRPEETILWSSDSKRFALTSRLGTRHLGCFFFGWQESGFAAMPWEDSGQLEELADQQLMAKAKAEGFTENLRFGTTITDDTIPKRWVDSDSIVVVRTIERSIAEGDMESAVGGSARCLIRWDARTGRFSMIRNLHSNE
ncbi:MAG: hypothetical protein KDN19_23490, partial [Verrucomicrobiae bacterium]|nr:hypothetical protein [Verrucomicrobiae bacterium]